MQDRATQLKQPQDEREQAPPDRDEVRRKEAAGVAPLAAVQQAAGNAAVVAMVGAQAKLTVGAVHDPAEAEADKVADQVLRNLQAGPISDAKPGAARMVRRKAAPSAAAASPGHGLEGGDALPDTTAAIERARGGGKSMDGKTLGRMESAFGADLSDVRVHTDGEAANLSRDLNAKAFTTGKDVFFGAGEYKPGTSGGDKVLAHELTHTIQQSGPTPSDGAQRIHRLTMEDTHWEGAVAGRISDSGSVGVGFLDDGGGELVVKPAEAGAAEVLIAANLINETIAGKEDGYTLGTPDVRIADATETARIKDTFLDVLPDASTPRATKWLSELGKPDTVIMSKAAGEDFKKVVNKQKISKPKGVFSKKRELREDSSVVAKICTEPGQLNALGKAGAVDIFTGNTDRVLSLFNMDNWMIDEATGTITLIDNVLGGGGSGFTENVGYGAFGTGPKQVVSAKDSFDAWAMGSPDFDAFMQGDFASIGGRVADNIEWELTNKAKIREEDKATLAKTIADNKANMANWFAAGMAKGKQLLKNGIADPMKIVRGVQPEKMKDALTNVIARAHVLDGMGPARAWDLAAEEAADMLDEVEV